MTNAAPNNQRRQPNYKEECINRLLDCVEAVLPCGGNDWQEVTVRFNLNRVAHIVEGDQDSLNRKYQCIILQLTQSLKNHAKPTGDPLIPPQVLRAKHLAIDMLQKMKTVEFGDQDQANLATELENQTHRSEIPSSPVFPAAANPGGIPADHVLNTPLPRTASTATGTDTLVRRIGRLEPDGKCKTLTIDMLSQSGKQRYMLDGSTERMLTNASNLPSLLVLLN